MLEKQSNNLVTLITIIPVADVAIGQNLIIVPKWTNIVKGF